MSKTHKITKLNKRIAELEKNLAEYKSVFYKRRDYYEQLVLNEESTYGEKQYDKGRRMGMMHAIVDFEEIFVEPKHL